jgi:hypothetical protein
MKKITKIESNHAKILECERDRYERRIRKLTQLLAAEKLKSEHNEMEWFQESVDQRQRHASLGNTPSLREAQFHVALLADSEQGL